MAANGATIASCQSGQTALAARLLDRFATSAAAAGGRNLVFSPLSIHVAVALMSGGASGDTLAEILAFAGAPTREELTAFVRESVIDRVLVDQSGAGGPTVAFACGAWTDWRRPLEPAYRDTIPKESRIQINA
ncbi:hypothetical protein EJB05_00336, partial [Eragrostis curvula]